MLKTQHDREGARSERRNNIVLVSEICVAVVKLESRGQRMIPSGDRDVCTNHTQLRMLPSENKSLRGDPSVKQIPVFRFYSRRDYEETSIGTYFGGNNDL